MHVISRGNNRRRLFSYATCYAAFLRALASSLRKHQCQLHALAILSNHLHMLVTALAVESLSKCMQRTQQIYAQRRNQLRDGSGKLFEERFKTFTIRDDTQLGRVSLYIDLNVYKAGMIAHPSAPSWTTYQLHAGSVEASRIAPDIWTPSSFWLDLGEDDAARREAYARIIEPHRADPLALIDDDEHREAIVVGERASEPYTLRLERPDRTRVADALDDDYR